VVCLPICGIKVQQMADKPPNFKHMKSDREVNLGVVVQNHLNNMVYDCPDLLEKRVKFVKALTFFHHNLDKSVSDLYLDWLWEELSLKNWGSSYEDFKLNN